MVGITNVGYSPVGNFMLKHIYVQLVQDEKQDIKLVVVKTTNIG